MKKWLDGWTSLGMLMLFATLPHLLGLWTEDPRKWWTPAEMAVPLDESRQRVEVLVAGQPLQRRLQAGALLLATPGAEARPLTANDIAFRFDNWDRVRAEGNTRGMLLVAILSWGASLVAFGIWRGLRPPRQEEPGRSDHN